MSLQALCGSPWFLTSALVIATSAAMLYRRVVISYGRAQTLRTALFLLVCFGLMLVFNFPFHLRHSIYDITEGKTSGPWRPEWGSHKSANTTTHADEVSAYILSIAKKHNLPHDIPFFARRLQAKTSRSGTTTPPSLTTLKSPFLPSPHTFRNTTTPTPHPPPLTLPLNRPPSPPSTSPPSSSPSPPPPHASHPSPSLPPSPSPSPTPPPPTSSSSSTTPPRPTSPPPRPPSNPSPSPPPSPPPPPPPPPAAATPSSCSTSCTFACAR